ncbi:hypothetical protein EFA46_007620 [Halarchaeum sp. CBA1220]|uniref:hypothetical protein n=1 Tax=Halarchaeum sp. CBA1220 TaxID=1853682 RepID=UPI000F3A8656|nr:hypothetical protein [Halarchaeum sp. CBA1220]QLC34077.1 hypothetical protein EFA46_007620 [Halarchaeum sp. CBA1220]
MARPLLSLALVFVGLLALAWVAGDVTGWWSMQAIVGDAISQTVGGFVDAIVDGAQGLVDWFFDRLGDALNPV